MINHARTLILNRAGGGQDLDDIGEEPIPRSFRPFEIPSWMRPLRGVLLGTNPENVYANLAVERLLRVVHSTVYANYLLRRDSRITYDPATPSAFAALIESLSFRPLTAGHAVAVDRIGELAADDVGGVLRQRWRLTIVNGVATAVEQRSGATAEQYIRDGASVVSREFALPASALRVRVRMDSTAEDDWDADLELTALYRSSRTPADVMRDLDASPGESFSALFSPGGEPWSTFQRLSQPSNPLPYRLAGVVLALAERSHLLWSGDGAV